MIQENEIRIGNWFHYDPIQWNYAAHSGNFKWSASDWFALGESTLFLEDITHILLTKDWLVDKFGFVFSHYHPDTAQRKYYNFDDFYVCEKDDRFYYDNKRIEYVHQLQNWYFCNEEKELEVK